MSEQEKQSVLQMDLMDFLEENITEKSLRTRMVNWIYRYYEIRTVGALVKYCQDYKYAHPIMSFRYIGRDCEKAIIEALGKYGIYINKESTIVSQRVITVYPADTCVPDAVFQNFSQDVLAFDGSTELPTLAIYDHKEDKWFAYSAMCFFEIHPTHWMELPRLQTNTNGEARPDSVLGVRTINCLSLNNLIK